MEPLQGPSVRRAYGDRPRLTLHDAEVFSGGSAKRLSQGDDKLDTCASFSMPSTPWRAA
jgi:hypothetical protein